MSYNIVDNEYSLSIRVRSDGFSFFVYDNSKKLISSENKPIQDISDVNQVEQIIKQLTISSINNVDFIIESDLYTLIPIKLFDVEKQFELLKLQHPDITKEDEVFHTVYNVYNCVLLFAFNAQIIQSFQNKFPSLSVLHYFHSYLEKVQLNYQDKIILILRPSKFDILIFKSNKIHLANSFSYQTEEDIIYYILRMFQLFSLDYENTVLDIKKHYGLILSPESMLKDYIKNISISNL